MKTNLLRLLALFFVSLVVGCQETPVDPAMDEAAYEWMELDLVPVEGPFEEYEPEVPGHFDFEDGTTQGWTLMQLYKSTGGPTDANRIQVWHPGTPAFQYYTPFVLSNNQNLSLKAEAPSVVISDPQAASVDIYLQSPDLSNVREWQNIQGYELDVMRTYFTWCGRPDTDYTAQLQVVVIEKRTGQEKVFAETWPRSTQFRFHSTSYYTNHALAFQDSIFDDARYTLKHLRIRFSMPGYTGHVECAPQGSWFLGNVTPIP